MARPKRTPGQIQSNERFNERTWILLRREGMTKLALAAAVGLTPRAIHYKMSNRSMWSDEQRERAAAALGTTLDSRKLPRLDSNQQPTVYGQTDPTLTRADLGAAA